jgi:glycosyltransferase involved in cell wall biosynthesis
MMLRLPHVLITNSECARQNLVSQGVASSKIDVISNVIDLQDFDRRSSQSVSIPVDSGQTVAVAVGRIDRNKRFDRLVRALALTRKVAPALTGLIVGRDLGQQSSLQAYAMTLDVDNLAIAGPSNHVPAILARSHMLIVTSDGEGFPNVLLEAMAGRLPVITTPAGDASAIVTRAKAGYVVDFDDATRMAERMVHLAKHPEVRGHLGCNGRQAVEENYDFESLPGRLLTTYKQATAEWKFPWPDLRQDTDGSTIDVETPDVACSEC